LELDRQIPRRLLPWYSEAKRPLPWRLDREPYHVWISEIMCQQTRVEAVKGYYRRFLEALPDVRELAECPEDELHKLWEGLGYYSRARNLKRAAKIIMSDHGGCFPSDYASIRALPGIGDYTAAAIASICFDLPCPAVDGNVLRVVTRLAASPLDITQDATKVKVREALRPLYESAPSAELTQALMELGALICVPSHEPKCPDCPLSDLCVSTVSELWKEIPVKSPKKPRKTEVHTVLLLSSGGRYALRRRGEKGLLAGLWEFPNLPGRLEAQEALDAAKDWGCRPRSLLRQTERRHVFTHREWELPAYRIDCEEAPDCFTWAFVSEIKERYSLPTAFRQFMEDISSEPEGGTL
jgi:A/G-specific adenine glycosylase